MHNKEEVNGWMERAIRELQWRPPLNKPPTKLSSADTMFDTTQCRVYKTGENSGPVLPLSVFPGLNFGKNAINFSKKVRQLKKYFCEKFHQKKEFSPAKMMEGQEKKRNNKNRKPVSASDVY
jgi:hypothetical protein